MRTESSASKGSNSCDLQCTARCAVPVLLAVAALTWSVIEFTDTKSDAARAQRVAVFNTSVQAWDGGRRAEFDTIASTTFVAGGFSAPTETTGGNLTKTTDDKNAGFWLRVAETDVHVPDWVPLLHKGSLAVTYAAGWGEATPVLSLTVEQDVEGVRQRYELELPPVAFTRTRTVRTTNWKVCEYTHRGSLSSAGVCYTREVLAALCVTVGRKAASDDSPGSSDSRASAKYEVTGGCGPRGFEADAPHATYSVLRGPRLVANGGIFTEKTETPYSFTIPVEVRSDQDPVLWAQYLSTGSSRRPFGQGATERKHMAYLMLGLCVVFLGIAGLSVYIHFRCSGGSETTLSDPDGSTWKSVVTGGEDQYESTSVDMRDHFGLQAGVLKRKSNVAKAGIRPPVTLKPGAPKTGNAPHGSRQQRLHVPATLPLPTARKGSSESVATQPSFVSTVPQVQGIGSAENNGDFGEIELVMAASATTPETRPLSPLTEDADAGTEMTPVAQEVTFEQQQKL